jgi:hypothetical protein
LRANIEFLELHGKLCLRRKDERQSKLDGLLIRAVAATIADVAVVDAEAKQHNLNADQTPTPSPNLILLKLHHGVFLALILK